jgi:ribonuclease HI
MHANKLFHNLTQAGLHELEDVCPLFDVYLADLRNDSANAPQELWEKEKGRITIAVEELLRCRTPEPRRSILHPDLRIPGASRAQFLLLKLILRIHLENLLAPFSPTQPNPGSETQNHWGMFKKHTLNVTRAYPDGSTTKGRSRAGFGVYFSELEATYEAYKKISSQIPGCQTIARVEGYGVLTALLLTSQEIELTIHCDRKPLVDQINRFRNSPPQNHELRRIKDRCLLFRIPDEIKKRTGTTYVIHVKTHMRDKASHNPTQTARILNATENHQEHNKVADHLAKSGTNAPSPEIPEEKNHVPSVSVLINRESVTLDEIRCSSARRVQKPRLAFQQT